MIRMKRCWALAALCASLEGLCAGANPAWIYVPDGESGAGVISNAVASGGWVLKVHELNADRGTLALGQKDSTENGAALVKDTDGAVKGTGVLDLSTAISDTKGKRWTIEEMKEKCLADDASPLTAFIAPRELRKWGGEVFKYKHTKPWTIVADCPYLKELSGQMLRVEDSTAKLTLSTFNAPNATTIGGWGFGDMNLPADAAWDLGNVQELSRGGIAWTTTPATLKLPGLQRFPFGGIYGGDMTNECALGTAFNTLQFVGKYAMDSAGYQPLKKLYFGCDAGCVFEPYAINRLVERVWFTGAAPTFLAGGPALGSRQSSGENGNMTQSHQSEKSIVLYVPTNASWTAIRARARELTQEEKSAFAQAHPTWTAPWGVLPAGVLGTENAQYIGDVTDADLPTRWIKVTTYAHRRYGATWTVDDMLTVTVNGVARQVPYGALVEVPLGAAVTVQISTQDGPNGEKAPEPVWEGNLPGTLSDGNKKLTFTVQDSVSFYVNFPSDWTFVRKDDEQSGDDITGGFITDGYWFWPVHHSWDDALAIAQAETYVTNGNTRVAHSLTLEGELNLTKGVVGGMDGLKWPKSLSWSNSPVIPALHAIEMQAFKNTAFDSYYAPRNLLTIRSWEQLFNNNAACANFVLDCTNLNAEASFAPLWWSLNSASVSRMIVRLLAKEGTKTLIENQTEWSETWNKLDLSATDLAEWDLASVTNVTAGALRLDYGPGPSGTLDLPNVETIGEAAFGNWVRVSSVALGTNGTLKSLGAYLFKNNGTARMFLSDGVTYTDKTNVVATTEWFPFYTNSVHALETVDFGKSHDFEMADHAFWSRPEEGVWNPFLITGAPLPIREFRFSGKAPDRVLLDKLVAGRTATADIAKGDVAEDLRIVAPLSDATWSALRKQGTVSGGSYYAARKELDRVLNFADPQAKKWRVVGLYQTVDGKSQAWLVQHPDFEFREGFVLHFR